MKKFSRAQLKSIIALNFAAIALLIGFFFFNFNDNKETPVNIEPIPHQRVRAAEISLNPLLSWELTLEGSGREEVVASFLENEYLYIFGNTTSSDLDFDRAGIFLAIVDTYGVTNSFFIYGEENDLLRAVTLCEGGFLLAIESVQSPKMLIVDSYGALKNTLTNLFHGFEEVLSLKYYSGGYFMLSQSSSNLTGVKSLRCSFFTATKGEIKFVSSSVATNAYSLTPIDTVVVSGKVIAICNASSSLNTVPAFVEFTSGQSASVKLLSSHIGEVMGTSVYDGDLLLLTCEGGSTLLQLNLKYETVKKTSLGQLKAARFYESTPFEKEERYLVFTESSAMIISGKGEVIKTLPAFSPPSTPFTSAFINGHLALCGIDSGKVTFNIYGSINIAYSADINDGENPKLAIDNSNLFCIYHSNNNIIITKLRYPLFL